ncbi:unnamed protein product [Caenorhabditis angaria]|uniref:Uncharacterized protein n=1 Tax=Caenorhabditis angaria TaxID=860376 RepID=A0A9P1IGY9_9PELO|nr:unnamed protein product [Caenorhabditis angaria]
MSKLLILLIIPAVLSRSIPTQQDENVVLAEQFGEAFLKAVQTNDYSIFAPNFEGNVYDQNGNLVGKFSKEQLFQIIQASVNGGNGVIPKGDQKYDVVRNNDKLTITIISEGITNVATVTILGQNRFILNSLYYYAPASLTNNLI